MKTNNTCFVVMPFGRKPIPDSGGRIFDFEKVYRVIIKRAIKQAGMEALRADERHGSHIVHAEMFADLRDHPIVLADLSLLNPNVFYELGIRHVMSAAGTVLMCRQGTVLPFDVNLSRVIFYEFDGESLDWEVVETVVQRVHAALANATRRQPDSPVHALLDRVLSGSGDNTLSASRDESASRMVALDKLVGFQKELAMAWKEQGHSWHDKAKEHEKSAFGLRVAAYLALADPRKRSSIDELPHELFFLEQYDLANELFKRKEETQGLKLKDALRYGSSLSEIDESPAGIKKAWAMIQSGLGMLDPKIVPGKASRLQAKDAAGAHYSAGAFLAWRYRCTGLETDGRAAIEELSKAQHWGESATAKDADYSIGQVAYTRLLLLVILRAMEGDPARPDAERHRETILQLKDTAGQNSESISYLHWYQVITLADSGSVQEALKLGYNTLASDAQIAGLPGRTVTGRQYRVLRRFIENYRAQLCQIEQIGRVSQMLQAGPNHTFLNSDFGPGGKSSTPTASRSKAHR